MQLIKHNYRIQGTKGVMVKNQIQGLKNTATR